MYMWTCLSTVSLLATLQGAPSLSRLYERPVEKPCYCPAVSRSSVSHKTVCVHRACLEYARSLISKIFP